jgi:hypothetical protein
MGKTTKGVGRFPKNVTLIGWLSLGIALTAVTVSIVLKYNEKAEKDRYRFWALRELEFTTNKLLKPYEVNTDPPEPAEKVFPPVFYCDFIWGDGRLNASFN